jgi:hypothetical protein
MSASSPLIEITIQSLKGVSFQLPSSLSSSSGGDTLSIVHNMSIPKITAAVAFSGSAANMQVGSSFLCPKTGNLMIESNVAMALPNQMLSSTTTTMTEPLLPLMASWGMDTAVDVASQLPRTDQPDDDYLPHVSIHLPPRDPRLPIMSISSWNRDSKIIATTDSSSRPSQPSLSPSDVSSSEESTRSENEKGDHTESVFWSQSGAGAVMPEIVELSVSIQVDSECKTPVSPKSVSGSKNEENTVSSLPDNTLTWEEEMTETDLFISRYDVGMAYLVLFGNDEGTTIMDLPVKQQNCSLRPKNIHVDPLASLCVRVAVYPHGKQQKAMTSTTPLSTKAMIQKAYELHDTSVLEPILRHLKIAENRKIAARGMKCTTETNPDKNHNIFDKEKDRDNEVDLKMKSSSSIMCGMPEFLDWFQSMRCDDGADGLFLRNAGSMDSTIQTAPSMTLW